MVSEYDVPYPQEKFRQTASLFHTPEEDVHPVDLSPNANEDIISLV